MNIALYDIDSKIPNLALMKISSYHKNINNNVEFYCAINHDYYNKIYCSSIFNFSDKSFVTKDMITGGTGFNLKSYLPIEIDNFSPDYSLYNCNYNIGYTMRGCRLSCKFCIVNKFEGKSKSIRTINELLTNSLSNKLLLLDNDFFGNPDWELRAKELIKDNIPVSIAQGINVRLLTDLQSKYLSLINYRDIKFKSKRIYTAWDNVRDEKKIIEGLKLLFKYNINPSNIFVYVLIGFNSTKEDDLYRINLLDEYGVKPFVMPYNKKDNYQNKFARWCNHKAVFNTIKFKDYH